MNRKAALIAITVALAASSATAFAQTAAQPAQQAQYQSAQTAQGDQGGTMTMAQWSSPDSMHSGITRSQVDRDYTHAKNDGQLQYLDSTLYAHH